MKRLAYVAFAICTAAEAHAASGVPLLGISVGETHQEIAQRGRTLESQGFTSSKATEPATQRNAGIVFSRPGKGAIGLDRLAVVFDATGAQVALLFRQEDFAQAHAPSEQVFFKSVADKFGIADLARLHNSFHGPLMWGETPAGPVPATVCFTGDLKYDRPYKIYRILYQDRNRTQNAKINAFDPSRIKMSGQAPACTVAYMLNTSGRGGTFGNVVDDYELTVLDLRLAARELAVEKGRGAVAQDDKQRATRTSPMPNF